RNGRGTPGRLSRPSVAHPTMQTVQSPRPVALPRPAVPSLAFTLAFLLAATLAAPAAHAQAAGGTITGTVADSATGKFLEGADVALDGSATHALTVHQGGFELRDVAPGSHSLVITYPGLEPKTATVTVAAGQPAVVNVMLGGSEVVTLSEFKVAGTKEGMSQAIALQKAAEGTMVVAAGDQYGDIAE